MTIRLTDLIAQIRDPETVRETVQNTRDRTRSVLQDALRGECRLVMRTPEETEERTPGAQVPVVLESGYPDVLKSIEFPDNIEIVLLLSRYRTTLEEASSGASGLLKLLGDLDERTAAEIWMPADSSHIRSTLDWAQTLLRVLDAHDPLGKVLAVREDILGVYKYEIESQNGLFFDDRQVNRASIRLYWAVLGLASQWMGCRVEDLTLVVLVHELAHAYTQLGADIEGRRWPPVAFTKADIEVKEGLAQYYTDRVLQRLKRRYPESFAVYKQMLPRQPKAYRTHLEWINNSTPEAVRRAMLETRRRQEGKLSDFNRRLADAQQQLKPLAQS